MTKRIPPEPVVRCSVQCPKCGMRDSLFNPNLLRRLCGACGYLWYDNPPSLET